MFNRLSVMFIKTKISIDIQGSINQHDKVRDLMHAIDEQFTTSHKSLASTLIMQFLSMKFTRIRTKISIGIQGSIDQHDKVRDLMHDINEQFTKSYKSLASTLIMQFLSMKLTRIRGVSDHIMHIRDIVAQLNGLEVTMSESFMVYYILCTLPHQYAPFKISYDTHKDKWSTN
ncbi:hypothetical protein CR513_37952, partial [Mucuna pruriens]